MIYRLPTHTKSGFIVILSAVLILSTFASTALATTESATTIEDLSTPTTTGQPVLTYPIVDTNQTDCTSDTGVIACGSAFNGQDAQYAGLQPSYQNNGDGTVTDLNTGLMWITDPGEKTSYRAATQQLQSYSFAGYSDWRLPTIKELYSLALFSGIDATPANSSAAAGLEPFIDTNHFTFLYGDESGGARVIDSQWLTSTIYNSTVMNDTSCFFGFNFADGRIKCYPLEVRPNASGGYFALFVRGGNGYGENDFIDNGDGTITDAATGLTWAQNDNGTSVSWDEALDTCETLTLGGYDDWRLPNVKTLQSIVDYSRSPDVTGSAAIDPIFTVSTITNEAGQLDYPFYWSSTTLISYPNRVSEATYVAFGRAMGYVENFGGWIDVHGAGSQRSDPKTGDSTDWPTGHGPQGDARRSDNYVRCVRGTSTAAATTANPDNTVASMDLVSENLYLFAPLSSTETTLIDAGGTTRYTWHSAYRPGHAVYLLENGNLLRTGSLASEIFDVGGAGGIVQEIAPDNTIVWDFEYASDTVQLHHDIEQLPDGNILMIAWEFKTREEATADGRDPNLLGDQELWPDHVIEVNPATNAIIWEWHIWDHLVQDYDANMPNYGVVAEHPELINLNYTGRQANADWTHINAIDYNAELDQILLSVHGFCEIWIIDHATTTEEAAGPDGDLLYRWGNPAAYDAGGTADQQFYAQHDARWIPDSGNILVFNNGNRQTRAFSSVDEIVPPLNAEGHYDLAPDEAYGPAAPTWSYRAANATDFYAMNISGAQRLPNGNTLICSGPDGRFFEVTPDGAIVWEYVYGSAVFRVTQIDADDARLAALPLQPGTVTPNE